MTSSKAKQTLEKIEALITRETDEGPVHSVTALDDFNTEIRFWQLLSDLHFLIGESDKVLKYAHEVTKALTGLAGGGSELFGKELSGIVTADIPYCVNKVRERESSLHRLLVEAKVGAK